MLVEERHEVVGLENLITELGVGDPLVGAAHPRSHGILGDHGAQWKMLAYIAQEGDDLKLGEPFVVVGANGGRCPLFKLHESLDLLLQTPCPFGDLRFRIQLPLAEFPAWIADQAGPAADQDDRTMTGTLKATKCQEREQTADVEAVGRRIEPHVDRASSFEKMLMQLMRLGAIGNQTSPL